MASHSHSHAGSSSSPLVAVLLITATTSRGPQLVFRYPRKPLLQRRFSKVRYYAAAKHHSPTSSAPRTNTNTCDGPQSHRQREVEEERRRDRDQWDEQEEDSGSAADAGLDDADSDISETSSLSSLHSSGDPPADSTRQGDERSSDSDLEATTASSGAEDDSAPQRPSPKPRRRGRRTPDSPVTALSRLTASKSRLPGPAISSSVSANRNSIRSSSRAPAVASPLRDPTASSSPERESIGGGSRDARRNAGRQGPHTNQENRNNTRSAADRHNSPSRRAKNAKAFSHYLDYPVDFLAELLAPKEEMCNRRFELVVDDLAFVGHPVLRRMHDQDDYGAHTSTDEEDDVRGRKGRDGKTSTRTTRPVSKEESTAPKLSRVTMYHLVFVLQPPDPSYATPTLDLTTWLGFWYDSVVFKMTAALWAEERRCEYISHQAELLSKLWGQVEGDSGLGPSYTLHMSRLLLLSSLAKTLRHMYRSLIHPSPHHAAFVTLNDTLDVHLQLPPLLVEPAKMVKSLLELGPSIEAEDADLWGGAIGGVAGVAGAGGRTEIGSALDEWTRTTGPPLFPWKTLLLLHDSGARPKRYRSFGGQIVEIESDDEDDYAAEHIDAELDGEHGFADAGIELWARKFTSLLKPDLQGVPTFADLASLLSWDLQEDVYPMARHLIYYKQARVVDVPRIQNTYALSPLFETSDLTRFSTSFALRFPHEPPLARVLAAVGSGFHPFISHYLSVHAAFGLGSNRSSSAAATARFAGPSMASRRRSALACLIWLLRHEIVLQQHLRFRLIATEAVKGRARDMWLARKTEREERRLQREERREWRREKRALKKGADPYKRKGELVPLVAQSAPDPDDGDLRAHLLSKRVMMQSENATEPVASLSLGHVARGRQRSRSAEGRGQDGGNAQSEALQSASRVSSTSRSRSRNPPPLGRIGPGGRITSTAASSTHSRPTSSSGLRATHSAAASPMMMKKSLSGEDAGAASPALRRESGLEFARRAVPRSRSPSSNVPPGATVDARNPLNSYGTGGLESGSRPFTPLHRRGPSSSSSGLGSGSHGLGMSSTDDSRHEVPDAPRRSASVVASQTSSSSNPSPMQRARGLSVGGIGSHESVGHRASEEESAEPSSVHATVRTRGRQRETSGSTGSVVLQGRSDVPRQATMAQATGSSGTTSSSRGVDRRISRSPSMARMRVRGFGEQEEVWIDGEEVMSTGEKVRAKEGQEQQSSDVGAAEDVACQDARGTLKEIQESRRLSLVGEEATAESDAINTGATMTGDAGEIARQQAAQPKTSAGVTIETTAGLQAPIPDRSLETDAEEAMAAAAAQDDDVVSEDEESESEDEFEHFEDEDEDESEPLYEAGPSLISEPSRASAEENSWIAAMIAGKDEAVAQGFFQLLPYLNGRHTIDEVICREEMRRRELRGLLSQFKEEILTFVHP